MEDVNHTTRAARALGVRIHSQKVKRQGASLGAESIENAIEKLHALPSGEEYGRAVDLMRHWLRAASVATRKIARTLDDKLNVAADENGQQSIGRMLA